MRNRVRVKEIELEIIKSIESERNMRMEIRLKKRRE